MQWLGLRTTTAEGLGSTPGQGTKISQAVWCGKKKEDFIIIIYYYFLTEIRSQVVRTGIR